MQVYLTLFPAAKTRGVKEALEVFFLFIAGESPVDAKVNVRA